MSFSPKNSNPLAWLKELQEQLDRSPSRSAHSSSRSSPQDSENLEGLFDLFVQSELEANSQPTNLTLDSQEEYLPLEEIIQANRSESEDDIERLRRLFLDLLIGEQNFQVEDVKQQLLQLQAQVNDPVGLSNVLLPIFAQLVARNVDRSPTEIATSLAPIIDLAITYKSQQDIAAMSKALAAAIPGAISKQLGDAPEEVIQALAPAMGRAIKEQIRLERDSMVDALYPVLGSTMSKYMGEVVSQINQRVDSTFSLAGIYRKLRAKMQGISDAELILTESLPFQVQAIFLIHKTSGLVIAQVQRSGQQSLEADMLGGMLTAIRSFASECIIQPDRTSELKEIDYDDFTIILEVAGYCYLATITQGEPPPVFFERLQQTLSTIILNYGYGGLIEHFAGDPTAIPQAVYELLEHLMNYPEALQESKPQRQISLGTILILALLFLPLGWWGYSYFRGQYLGAKINGTFARTPELAVYAVHAKVDGKSLQLTGKVPNHLLRDKAGEIATGVVPELALDNQILAVQPPPDPIAIQGEVERLTNVFNLMGSIVISSTYDRDNQQVIIEGRLDRDRDTQSVTTAFSQIPGVKTVIIALATYLSPLQYRVYFETNSEQVSTNDRNSKLLPLVKLLQRNPELQVRIIGHTDASGKELYNQQLALRRAEAVQQILSQYHITADRLEVLGQTEPPPGISPQSPFWLSRTVRFEALDPGKNP